MIGTTELLVILAIIIVVFGASRLPQLGSGLGQGIRNFKSSLKSGTASEEKRDRETTQKTG